MESNKIEIYLPSCSSQYPIFKDIYAFLYTQGNQIQIDVVKSKSFISGGGTFYDSFSHYMDNIFTQTPASNTPSLVITNQNQNQNQNQELPTNITPSIIEESKPNHTNDPNTQKNNNSIVLEFTTSKTNKTYTIDNIKGTKLYYLFLRNGECARWI
jgi:hypothetical protein